MIESKAENKDREWMSSFEFRISDFGIFNPQSAIRNPQSSAFTLIELLVVVAIIAVLISILVPSLGEARSHAKMVICSSKMRQLGIAHTFYQQDWEGRLAHSITVDAATNKYQNWYQKVGDYVGGYVKPRHKKGTIWICPEQPDGNFVGNFPSWNVNRYLGTVISGHGYYPAYRLSEFSKPAYKVFIGDCQEQGVFFTVGFRKRIDPEGHIRINHPGPTANMAFLDGHVQAYGAPPLPEVVDHAEASKWLIKGVDPPEGI
jgi:prepilin-type N-terminal cleavage/methylation domain-containing protein/prepilin-type processing-associated H-X9-DG protein